MAHPTQEIRACSKCGDLLPLKCQACLRHPGKKPRPIILYDCPPILATGPCGCILITCQRPGCAKRMWRTVKSAKQGESHYCDRRCWNLVLNAGKKTRKLMPCGNEGCRRAHNSKRKMIEVHLFRLERAEVVCCSTECRWEQERRVKKRREDALGALLALYCAKCAAVTNHARVRRYLFRCITPGCGTRRSDEINSAIKGEVG